MRRTLTALTATLVLHACGAQAPTAPSPTDLAAAPTRVVFAGTSLVLDAELWRDFMPVTPPDGRPLIAVLRVRTEDGSRVPAAVGADTVWLLSGGDTWSTTPREEQSRDDTAPAYELVARDGPKWAPGTAVDVVVRLHDRAGRQALLRVANSPIKATY
jgi:hypothetical protein